MGCTLNKFKTYNVGQVRHDVGTGSYSVQITDQVPRCPDGVYNTKKAKLVVKAGSMPSLGYDTSANRPLITVPSEAYVINYGESSFGFGSFLLLALGAAALYLIGKAIYNAFKDDEYHAYAPSRAANVPYSNTANAATPGAPASTAQPGNTVINNNSGGSDLLTGVLIGNMLSGGGHSHDTTIIERERIVERDNSNFSSDNDDNDSSSSSDFSSDSSDSSSDYSSDSSDSSSDYSSDSSSSGSDFGSDSSGGGSDF